jgi:signal transduction histidine kinase
VNAPRPARSLRLWLTCALLCIIALPPLAIWVAHAATGTATGSSTGPDARTLAAARSFAAANVTHWTDPAWQHSARAYFTASQVDAELRPTQGPWFTAGSAPSAAGRVDPGDKFTVQAPGKPGTILGSGWVIPHPVTHTSWTMALTAGAVTLALTVAAVGAFLGRHVVRPLAAISRAAGTVPHGEFDLHLPATRVGEVAHVAAALQAMSTELHASLDQQADMEEQRRQFIGAIAHDLRTPLFTLRAYLDGLGDGLATSPQKADRYLQVCRSSATALDRLVTDLFTYARMEFLDQQPRSDLLDFGALLHAAAQAHLPQADAKHITLAVTTAAPCTLSGDEHLLTRVIGNLLDNALRHTPDGGRINLDSARTKAEAIFTITDTGPGIAAADLPHLFTPLYRGETSRNRATGGAGLGLAIAQRIVHAHHGTITARNITPHGVRFTVRIPAGNPHHEDVGAPNLDSVDPEPPRAPGQLN